jgi:TonB family protein
MSAAKPPSQALIALVQPPSRFMGKSLQPSPAQTMKPTQQALPLCPVFVATLLSALLLSSCAGVDTRPKRIVYFAAAKCELPEYPFAARRKEITGRTGLRVEVNPEGVVTSVVITKSSGDTREHDLLDSLAKKSFQTCVFAPAPGTRSATAPVDYVWKLVDP